MMEGQTPLWDRLTKRYIEFLRDKETPIAIFDTWKMVWSWNTMAYLQTEQEGQPDRSKKKKQLGQMDYGIPNARMDGIVNAANLLGKDLILIAHERPIYEKRIIEGKVESIPTGEFEPNSYNGTPALADWQFHTGFAKNEYKKCERCGKPLDGEDKDKRCPGFHFWFDIQKSPIGAELVGSRLVDPTYEKLEKFVKMYGKEL